MISKKCVDFVVPVNLFMEDLTTRILYIFFVYLIFSLDAHSWLTWFVHKVDNAIHWVNYPLDSDLWNQKVETAESKS